MVTIHLPESTLLVWYCGRCRKSCKVQPPDPEQVACRCNNPVPGLRPTRVTVMHAPKARPMHALSNEEARLRALARRGTRVRVTFEATVADAMQWTAGDRRGLEFDLTTADGRRHTIDPQLPGLHIEAIATDEESAS
ncbi:hypothetical protein [Streptomyces sp. NBC_01716]|uniref:hypothetical protein n=1 Tax=Streptomyces sp. NBC_01716 TaxID=2975917 RepID=UPI002E30B327|nr:hypothetical protein [Streptomyces sp. NBC_01716]